MAGKMSSEDRREMRVLSLSETAKQYKLRLLSFKRASHKKRLACLPLTTGTDELFAETTNNKGLTDQLDSHNQINEQKYGTRALKV